MIVWPILSGAPRIYNNCLRSQPRTASVRRCWLFGIVQNVTRTAQRSNTHAITLTHKKKNCVANFQPTATDEIMKFRTDSFLSAYTLLNMRAQSVSFWLYRWITCLHSGIVRERAVFVRACYSPNIYSLARFGFFSTLKAIVVVFVRLVEKHSCSI